MAIHPPSILVEEIIATQREFYTLGKKYSPRQKDFDPSLFPVLNVFRDNRLDYFYRLTALQRHRERDRRYAPLNITYPSIIVSIESSDMNREKACFYIRDAIEKTNQEIKALEASSQLKSDDDLFKLKIKSRTQYFEALKTRLVEIENLQEQKSPSQQIGSRDTTVISPFPSCNYVVKSPSMDIR